MANPEHLKILKQGVDVWNQWRENHPYLVPDLSNGDFVGADLRGLDLHDALLEGANLERAILRRANFQKAGLSDALLRHADLLGTDLRFADLRGAVLSEARVGHALVPLSFDFDAFAGADLTSATFFGTSVVNVDLSLARGLRARHRGPSDIATTTLRRTAAGLSHDPSRSSEVENFLRAAGVPELIMDAFKLMIGTPLQFCTCFISYSHADENFARRLYVQLQARGIRCWLDEHDLKPGDRILDVVDHAIRLHDKILLCCSQSSLESWWVKDEIRKAMDRERRDGRDIIIPLMVDRYLLDGWEDGLAADLRSRLAADFTGWEHDNAKFEEQFERLVEALKTNEVNENYKVKKQEKN